MPAGRSGRWARCTPRRAPRSSTAEFGAGRREPSGRRLSADLQTGGGPPAPSGAGRPRPSHGRTMPGGMGVSPMRAAAWLRRGRGGAGTSSRCRTGATVPSIQKNAAVRPRLRKRDGFFPKDLSPHSQVACGRRPSARHRGGHMAVDVPGFRLGIYVFKDAEIVDFAAPYGVFSVARRFDPELDAFLIADAMRPVQAQAGFTVLPNYCFNDQPAMDAFLIPGGFGTRQELHNRKLHDFVRALPPATLLTSVCTGS